MNRFMMALVSRCSSVEKLNFLSFRYRIWIHHFATNYPTFIGKSAPKIQGGVLFFRLSHVPLVSISFGKRKTNSSDRCSRQLSRRGRLSSSVEIFLARPFRTLSARFHFPLSHPREASCDAICNHPLSIGGPSTRTYMCVLVYVYISRPVINKSIALLSRTAGARSTCSTFMTERGREP